jgi:hypothetical protein
VFLALLPVLANLLSVLTRGSRLDLEALLGRGELLLIAVVVAGSAGSELQELDSVTTRGALTGFVLIMVCLGSIWFADVTSVLRDGGTVATGTVAFGSVIMFLFASLTKLSVMLATRAQGEGRDD